MRPEKLPADLLAKPIPERLAYFARYVVPHPRITALDASLTRVLRHPVGIPLVVVLGPSGVGKSTLGRRLRQRVLDEEEAAVGRNPGYQPVVCFEAGVPETGNFH